MFDVPDPEIFQQIRCLEPDEPLAPYIAEPTPEEIRATELERLLSARQAELARIEELQARIKEVEIALEKAQYPKPSFPGPWPAPAISGPGGTYWSKHGQTVSIKGNTITVDDLSKVMPGGPVPQELLSLEQSMKELVKLKLEEQYKARDAFMKYFQNGQDLLAKAPAKNGKLAGLGQALHEVHSIAPAPKDQKILTEQEEFIEKLKAEVNELADMAAQGK